MVYSKMVAVLALGLALSLPAALALCPNACSDHGTCGAFDRCSCYAGYIEGDCSGRRCPYGTSWADKKDTDVTNRDAHYYAECSGKGTCDREKGVCECLDGFEGKSCQRLSCPDSCNGHGICQLMEDANSGYALWDHDMMMTCVCDAGWTGVSCLERMCKKGDDPMSVFDINGAQTEADEVQTIVMTLANAADATSEFILTYEDWRGEKLTTHPIPYPPTAIAVKEALEALPNHAIPSITVSITETVANRDYSVAITFSDPETPGNQPMLVLGHAGCYVDGCQPVYYGLYDTSRANGLTVSTVTETTAGNSERRACSSRGLCNSETGVCECFPGYYGEACNKQTIVV